MPNSSAKKGLMGQNQPLQNGQNGQRNNRAGAFKTMNLTDPIQVLVVDDEKMIRNLLKISLQKMGYEVTAAADGVEALQRFETGSFHLVLLDILMPGIDGFGVCAELRKQSDVPIVMLTALNRPDDVVRALELGADNYITKPFTFKEVEARIRAILRRTAVRSDSQSFQVLVEGDVKLDSGLRAATVGGQLVELTRTEYQLLLYLMTNIERAVSKEELLQDVWGYEASDTNSNIVELAIRRLRKKIEENPSNPRRLATIRGVGYRFIALDSKKDNALRTRHRGLPKTDDPIADGVNDGIGEVDEIEDVIEQVSISDNMADEADGESAISEMLEHMLDDIDLED
jgi:DNA-binding response OmpR family regulator